MRRRLPSGVAFLVFVGLARAAYAEEPAAPPAQTAPGAPEPLAIDLTKDTRPAAADPNTPPPDAPPPVPYKRTVVLDSSLGAMVFLGEFGKVAPPGPWLHTQLGYEVLKWLMLFGEGELAFTDTSRKQDPPKTRAFAIFGGGGGVRFTIRFTDRVGVYAQGSVGMMKADVGTNALGILGFRDAEALNVYLGGRLGFEWFQLDRHFALGLTLGVRTAQGFARTGAGTDSPLVADTGASLRYAF
jgi:hypothetical protein